MAATDAAPAEGAEGSRITALDWVVIVAGVAGLVVLLLWAYRDHKRPSDGGTEG